MSSTASNYDMSKLIAGQALAALTLFLAIFAAGSTISGSIRTVTPFILVALFYGIMMFASSYVEEEQHFWYWATTAWLIVLWIKKYVHYSHYLLKAEGNSNRQWRNRQLLTLIAVTILIAMLVARRWNQTGQKYAGEPDIGRTFLFEHRIFFWTVLCITYLWNLQSLASNSFPQLPQLISGGIATALATAAVTFKLAFTYEDSPELMVGVVKSMADNDVGISLVLRARIVFTAILIAVIYTIGSGFRHPKRDNRRSISSPTPTAIY
jgi:ethanolaminephosphotransferase